MPATSPPSTAAAEKRRAKRVYAGLLKLYPDATCALRHRNAFELLVATILSAQCTDVRVNMVTPALFAKYPDTQAMAQAELPELEELIRSTGFYRTKAKAIKGSAQAIVRDFAGRVPDSMEKLLTLSGVARKTANVVLGNAFGQNVGMVVDTHVARLSQRLGFTQHKDPARIERDLMTLFPRESWTMLAHLLIFHGRQICKARKALCETCGIRRDCPKIGVMPPK
jgi:endonuclease III